MSSGQEPNGELADAPTAGRRFDFPGFTRVDDPANHSDEVPGTPTLAQSYGAMKRNLSFKSLKDLEMKQMRDAARDAVWRKGGRGEPGEDKSRPMNMEQVLVHALTGGARNFVLGYGLRAGVNLLVVALRVTKKRGIPRALIIRALFGSDTVRFGGMLGLFTFLYKFTRHTLRVCIGEEQVWHAAVAGAVSGIAVCAEKPSRRVTIAQQLFVRGLQGYYNIGKGRGWIKIKNGDVLLFGFACAQIMYSWMMAPEALPTGYRRWVTNASRMPAPAVLVNIAAARTHTFNPADARAAIVSKFGATPTNASWVEAYAQRAEAGDFGNPFAPCQVVHPWVDSCGWTAVDRWQSVFRWMFPVYAALHVIPPILLRHKTFMKSPSKALFKASLGTIRSCSFLAGFVTLYQVLFCSRNNLYLLLHGRVPDFVEKLMVHKGYYWLVGFSTCLSLFFEEKKRRGELAMYVLPRGLESLWSMLQHRSFVPIVPGGEIVLTSLGLSLVMSTYQHQPKALSGLVRSILFQLLGQG